MTYDASDRVASLSAPTLILHGRRDRTVPVELARDLANQIPGAQLTLFRGGHMFFLFSQRHEALRRVEEFLADPESPPSEG